MNGSRKRVLDALAFRKPDHTPLFEIFQPYHPIHWRVCGRNLATDMVMAWDAMSDGVAWEELLTANVRTQFEMARFFGLDMVRLNGPPPANYVRPVKTGKHRWTLNGVPYCLNERISMVELENPGVAQSYSRRVTEEEMRRRIEAWPGPAPAPTTPAAPPAPPPPDPVLTGVQRLAAEAGLDWVFMGEIGAGTGVAFYPPFMLMWLADEPALVQRYIAMAEAECFPRTRQMVAAGCAVVAMGGDVSADKGPFLSPAMYREFILPAIQRHVQVIHEAGARAVYTSDGNHWPIRDMFFFESGIDGYKEVDQAAGMTWPRLIDEGVAGRVCIIGNLDARHTLCHAAPQDVKREVGECLRYGQRFNGGHILHASHSVHEDVKIDNYVAAVQAYREFFGLPQLEW